jgi:hypothetical protein
LVCQPGFTTRVSASDISGRGVGLDAVRVGAAEVGGALSAATSAGLGTSWRVSIPLPRVTVETHMMRAPGLTIPFVIDAHWQLVEPAADATIVDIANRLGLVDDRGPEAVHYFARDGITVGLVTERAPVSATARRIIALPPPAPFEIVAIDTAEGLLVHPERMR